MVARISLITFLYSPGVQYGGCILDDISFQARSGELSVVLGGSGSGKTTLLDAISARLDNRGFQTGKVGAVK